MGMLKEYANQSVAWLHVSSLNAYNEPVYSASVNILARIERGHKLVRNAQGEVIVSTAWLTTESAVDETDLVDGRIVVSVEKHTDLDGVTQFYEVYLV